MRRRRFTWLSQAVPVVTLDGVDALRSADDSPPEDRVPVPSKAIASGGSTGRPKLIVDPRPMEWVEGKFPLRMIDYAGLAPDQVQLMVGPLSHSSPFLMTYWGLAEGHTYRRVA